MFRVQLFEDVLRDRELLQRCTLDTVEPIGCPLATALQPLYGSITVKIGKQARDVNPFSRDCVIDCVSGNEPAIPVDPEVRFRCDILAQYLGPKNIAEWHIVVERAARPSLSHSLKE